MDKTKIEPNEFSGKGLTSVVIPDGIVFIGYDAYRNNKIKELIIPNSVKVIEFQAFCENKIERLTLSENLNVINKSVFSNNKIKKIIIPPSVKIIDRTAFQYNKITELSIPETVREIWTGAFYENKIRKITIGSHVNFMEGEYDSVGRYSMSFGEYGGFLELYKGNGRSGGVYTYNKEQDIWKFKSVSLSENPLIKIWSNEAIRYTEDNLCDLTFGVNPETKNVCLKREDGTFGHIELNDALSKTYRVIDKDGNVEFFSTAHDLTNAGWVLD
jgi:hypothetical protein